MVAALHFTAPQKERRRRRRRRREGTRDGPGNLISGQIKATQLTHDDDEDEDIEDIEDGDVDVDYVEDDVGF